MIDLKDFRRNPEKYRLAAELKRMNVDVDHVLRLDAERLRSQQTFERLRAEQNVRLCHTLNNTVIASPRILIPILENCQNADGSVTIPLALRPYVGGQERIVPPADVQRQA